MKFLCLHGVGTSNKILQMQTAAIRYELGDNHKYEYAQGVLPCPLPSELEGHFPASEQNFAYYDTEGSQPLVAESVVTALNLLETHIANEGPFDGVLAFSHGAGLASMLLARRQLLRPEAAPLFRVAVLFSPITVYDPRAYAERKEVKPLTADLGMAAIKIPTALVYGRMDNRIAECRQVEALCEKDRIFSYVHEGGHEIPGIGVKDALPGTVRTIRRAVTSAELQLFSV